MKKEFNLEAIVDAIKSNPNIIKKYGIDPVEVDEEFLGNMTLDLMMDILMDYSSPIRELNK